MSRSILIIEDNPVSAKTLEIHLRKQGYECILAQSGTEALQCLQFLSRVDLIIADVMMPEMNGLEFLKAMKANPAWQDIPVIMATSLSDVQTIKQAFEAGCRHYLVKPIKAAQLLQKVRETLDQEPQVLRDKFQVMEEVGLDAQAYDEVAQAFSALVHETTTLLEQAGVEGRTAAVPLNLRDLWEGSMLLGAEKVAQVLDPFMSASGPSPCDIAQDSSMELLQELKLVLQAMETLTSSA